MTIDHEHADLSITRLVSTGMQSPRRSVSNGIAIWKTLKWRKGQRWKYLGRRDNFQQPKCLNSKQIIPAQRTKPPNAPSTCCQHNQARRRQHCAFISWGRGGYPRVTNLETAGCWFQFYLLRETQVHGSCWASFPYLHYLEIFRFLRGT